MVKFRVELSSKARKFYVTCVKDLACRLDDCFKELEDTPYQGPNIKQLKTRPQERLYRYRIGDYRVIYEVFHEQVLVLVVKIAKREDVYKSI